MTEKVILLTTRLLKIKLLLKQRTMKKIILLIVMLYIAFCIQAQSLLDVYHKGQIKLVPDTEYAKNTDWNKIFDDRNDEKYGNPIGKMKSIAVSSSGELFISNYSKYNIYKFDANGNFVKEFGKEGGKKGEFLYRPTLHGILDNKLVFASDHQGRIQFYDLGGNFVKMVKIDYMPLQIVPLKNNKIAIAGHVPYNGDTKYIVSIKDIVTGEEKIIDSYFNSLIKLKPIRIKTKDGGMFGFSPSGLRDKTILEKTFDGNLIVSHNVESILNIFSPDGNKIKTINLELSATKTSAEEKEKFLNGVKDFLIKKDLYEENKDLLNDPNIYPENYPLFYSIKTDPEGNVLVFKFTKEKGNSFLVFDKTGKFICESKLYSESLKLDINSRFSTFEISPDAIYAFVSVIDSSTSELKIIRAKLK